MKVYVLIPIGIRFFSNTFCTCYLSFLSFRLLLSLLETRLQDVTVSSRHLVYARILLRILFQ